MEAMISRIEQNLRHLGEREVSSKTLGEIVMAELKAVDAVAYVRFASVYRDFQDINAFRVELESFSPNEQAVNHVQGFVDNTVDNLTKSISDD